jgi:deoxyribose-phosphate aldolase
VIGFQNLKCIFGKEDAKMTVNELAKRFVVSLIEAYVTEESQRDFINEMSVYPLYAIAVDLPYIDLAKELLTGKGIKVATVVSYPLGGMSIEVKLKQIEYAILHGADEVNVSMNYIAIKSGDWDRVRDELGRIVNFANNKIDIVVIPQTDILTNKEKVKVCEVILESGINKLKLNSGFGWNTLPEDILLIKRVFGDRFERLDFSGGIRTYAQVLEYLNLGVSYLHSSTPKQIFDSCPELF